MQLVILLLILLTFIQYASLALFQPLRHRIQAIIDRRFYRSKYNAAKIISSASITSVKPRFAVEAHLSNLFSSEANVPPASRGEVSTAVL